MAVFPLAAEPGADNVSSPSWHSDSRLERLLMVDFGGGGTVGGVGGAHSEPLEPLLCRIFVRKPDTGEGGSLVFSPELCRDCIWERKGDAI